jgi:hypothetical protein
MTRQPRKRRTKAATTAKLQPRAPDPVNPTDDDLRGLLERLAKLRDVGGLSDADHDCLSYLVRYAPAVWAEAREAAKLGHAVQQARQLWDAGNGAGALRVLGLTSGKRGRPGPSPREVVELFCAAVEGTCPGYVDSRLRDRLGAVATLGPGWVGKAFSAEEVSAVYHSLREGEEPVTVCKRSLGLMPTERLTPDEALAFLERAFGWEAERGRRNVEEARASLGKSADPGDRELYVRCPPLSYPEWQKEGSIKSPNKRDTTLPE